MQKIAQSLNHSIEQTARAIIDVAEANMARACKRVTMERGVDPRGITLVAFGGAAGLHACALADALGCADVVFPKRSGVLSADGILTAERAEHATLTILKGYTSWTSALFSRWCVDLWAGRTTVLSVDAAIRLIADCRYRGQTFTLPIEFDDSMTPGAVAYSISSRPRKSVWVPTGPRTRS